MTKAKKKDKLPKGITTRGERWRWQLMFEGERHSGTTDTLTQAKEARLRKLEELRNASADDGLKVDIKTTKVRRAEWTLGDAVEFCIATPVSRGGWSGSKGVRTAALSARNTGRYKGLPSSIRIKDITREDLEDYCSWLEDQGNSDGTINRKMCGLSKILKLAMDQGKLDALPRFPRRRKEGKHRITYLEHNEEAELLAHLDRLGKKDHVDAVSCLIDTGARPSELYWIKKRDVDLERRFVTLTGRDDDGTKNGEFRTIPLSRRAYEIMARRAEERGMDDRLFPYTNSWMTTQWERVRAKMGKDDPALRWTPYICRRTRACRLAQRGEDIYQIQKLLGHKSIVVTQRYADLFPKDLQAMIDRDDVREMA